MMEADFVKLAVEVSSFGLVAWLMLQTFSKTIPMLMEQFRHDLQREREASERGLREVTEALERLSTILIYHDATVRARTPRPWAQLKNYCAFCAAKWQNHEGRFER